MHHSYAIDLGWSMNIPIGSDDLPDSLTKESVNIESLDDDAR
jgi:hypothetical protein